MGSQRMIECACCGQPGRLGGRGLIVNCESRLRKYHRDDLADFPRQLRARADMLDDYATWRARRPQATQQEIAGEMGVTRSALRRAIDRDRARSRDDITETGPSEGQEEKTMATYKDDFEAQAVGALMNTPSWLEATSEEREAARERWLGADVDDAIEAINTQRTIEGPAAGGDQWRAAGTAGHDQEWLRWEEDEDRSVDRSDVLER